MAQAVDFSKTKNLGIYFGTFAPFHQGHYQQLIKALSENDSVIVFVSGYKNDRGDKNELPLAKRVRLLKETLKDEPAVFIDSICEDNIPEYPEGWTPWLSMLINKIHKSLRDNTTLSEMNWYIGEPEYKEELDKRLPEHADVIKYFKNVKMNAILADRSDFDVSATKIRNNPIKYYSQIGQGFKRHFVKKVAFVGAPSSGKSTLLKRVAKTFGSNFSVETARGYEENSAINDDDLNAMDYKHFILDQFTENSKVINNSNNGLVFLDTTSLATKVYAELYLSKEDNEFLKPFFDDSFKNEEVDLFIITGKGKQFVLDGSRSEEWADDSDKFVTKTKEIMKEYLKLHPNCKVLYVNNLSNDFGYYERYQQVLQAVENTTNYHAGHLK